MKIAFLTEMGFNGIIPEDFTNMRVEYSWMCALGATHYHLSQYKLVEGFDAVFIIYPKGGTTLSCEGVSIGPEKLNKFSAYYSSDIVIQLKENNKKVCFVQEGPTWYVNDFAIVDQCNFYNRLQECDVIFAHNEHDIKWYKGWYPSKKVSNIPSIMYTNLADGTPWAPENKVLIGGNFCRWYGGFQSYLVAEEFEAEKWIPSMHNKRADEDKIPDLNHLKYVYWNDWIKIISTFKYAIHMMPTVAAGTFSLNCAYYGIPCIGNELVDTQRKCYPELSVHPEDVEKARNLAIKLKKDLDFYNHVSSFAKKTFTEINDKEKFRKHIFDALKDNE